MHDPLLIRSFRATSVHFWIPQMSLTSAMRDSQVKPRQPVSFVAAGTVIPGLYDNCHCSEVILVFYDPRHPHNLSNSTLLRIFLQIV
jgi:hypothetical protein